MEEGDLKSLSPSTTNTEGLSEEEERILLEKEFDTGPHNTNAGYDPHMDDYQPPGGADGPPSYRPPSSTKPPTEDAKIEDIVE